MPLPNDQIPALCLEWANGDQDAARFLENWSRIVRIADDIADGDSAAPVPDMAELLVRCLTANAGNPFFQANINALSAVMNNAIMLWVKSEEWRRSTNEKTRMFGFVGREAVEHVAYTVGMLTGGYGHALAVIEDNHVRCHQSSPETFADWEAE